MRPEYLMGLAIDAAWEYQGMTYPNPAVGCVLTGPLGEILSVAAHQKAGGPHAEVLALKFAYRLLSGDDMITEITDATLLHDYLRSHHEGMFSSCTIYVTLEPCAHHGKTPSCATLIKALGISKVVIAHEDPNPQAAGGAQILRASSADVSMGLSHEKAAQLLAPFMIWQKRSFVFFKWAQRLDGTIDGGTISCEQSRIAVHAMRDVCDLLVIGGNTVRTDRPTLDARLVGGKAPDVLILSHESVFDQSIPLFGVKARKVMISQTLEPVKAYKNVMIEGGPGLFAATKEIVDHYLCYIAPKSGGTIPFTKERRGFTILHSSRSDEDSVMWLKGK